MTEGPVHPEVDAAAIVEVLDRHRVEFIVVGGYAATLHGSLRRTVDIDVVPSTDLENLGRRASALGELGARIRTSSEPEGLPFNTSAEALLGMSMLNLVTAHGEVDLTFTPSGTAGYADLHRSSTAFRLGSVAVQVASLSDVIRSKTAAGRSKDLDALPELRRLAAGDTA